MGKKMKFPFLFRSTEPTTSAASSWPWTTCANNPRTLSFRSTTPTSDNIYKTMNSAYLPEKNNISPEFAETQDSYFTIFEQSHEESLGFSTEPGISGQSEPESDDSSPILHGLRAERLFFEPGETSSILEEAEAHDFSYKENVEIMAMDSQDPILDFRVSMEEMVEAHGLKDWECLEELLACYLKVNRKSNHGYIVGAFVDLLINLALVSTDSCSGGAAAVDENCSASSTATQFSFTSPLSFSSSTYTSTSPCLSSRDNEEDAIVEKIKELSSSSSSCNASSSSSFSSGHAV